MLQLSKLQCMRTLASVDDSYELCRQVTASYAKNFYLGTQLMPEAKRRAIWAIYVWCRRTDELVDGPGSEATTPETLNLWEKRLESVFAGHPHDDYDVALVDAISRFPIDIEPFREMIAGQQMDLYRSRYETFEELNLYCYRVAGTVGLMSMSVMGVDESNPATNWNWHWGNKIPKEEAIALGIAKQLTNILRDVGEDARRGRIYLPLEDLALFNYTEADLFLSAAQRQLAQLGISGHLSIPLNREGKPSRKTIKIKQYTVVGFTTEVSNISLEDSLKLQVYGLGGKRRMGCGIFMPVREGN